eukprot:TRINITY_DN9069_c0_g1_i2.p1 TRINITY_DN9069_c0_g1~~TRINITY_DN9069_c0_g1_i2.p1  ORF type:complete len:271 (+),score=76.79 TRINITY_DN9069_c0_g1_i2:112-924(+)
MLEQKGLEVAGRQLAAILQADRQVSEQIAAEVDGMKEELRQILEVVDQLTRELARERKGYGDLGQQQQGLERDVQQAVFGLAALHEDRRLRSLDACSVSQDRRHFSEELQFLARVAPEEQASLEALLERNWQIQESYHQREAHAVELEAQRRDLVREADQERQLLRVEERQLAELRIRLHQAKHDFDAALVQRKEAAMRQLLVAQMNAPEAPSQGDRLPPPRQQHSWASTMQPKQRYPEDAGVTTLSGRAAASLAQGGMIAAQRGHGGID